MSNYTLERAKTNFISSVRRLQDPFWPLSPSTHKLPALPHRDHECGSQEPPQCSQQCPPTFVDPRRGKDKGTPSVLQPATPKGQEGDLPATEPARSIWGFPPPLQPHHQFSPNQRESAAWKALGPYHDIRKHLPGC